MKYKDWLDEWLENYVKPTTKIRTYDRYSYIVKNDLAPALGEQKLKDLTPAFIQRYVTSLSQRKNMITGKPLSPYTQNAVVNVIQNSLKTAYSVGYIKVYTAGRIKRPKIEEKQIQCFTASEQKKIESYALSSGKQKLFGVVLCLYTGLRIGELLALRWKDIDLKNGLLTVDKTCYDRKNEFGKSVRTEGTPKTKSSMRTIPIPKQLYGIIKEYKKTAASPYVVAQSEKTFSVRSYQQTFERLLKKLDIPHRCFHTLRHTFATRAIECGMDVKTLSELLGHKSPTVTLERYVHSLTEHKRDMMNKLGKIFEVNKGLSNK